MTVLQISMIAVCISLSSVVVASVALIYIVRSDTRKSGMDVRSNFAISSSISSEDKWVSILTLQNEKDRAVTIYKIYVESRHGIFVLLENFENKPLIIEPYGMYHREYDPVDFYVAGHRRLTGVLENKRSDLRIVLSTSNGRHFSRTNVNPQDPLGDGLLTNYASGVVWPMRLRYKGKSYGSKVKYIVTLTYDEREPEVIPIYPDDHEIRKFRNFKLTREVLESQLALEEFLREQISAGNLPCQSTSVLDVEPDKIEFRQEFSECIPIPTYGWFRYNVLFRSYTKWLQIWEKVNSGKFSFLSRN